LEDSEGEKKSTQIKASSIQNRNAAAEAYHDCYLELRPEQLVDVKTS